MLPTNTSAININATYSDSTILTPFAANRTIRGLAVNGQITSHQSGYLVRMVLVDSSNKEYLVMESYDQINDSATIHFNNYCRETNYLTDIIPTAVKIYIKNAVIRIDNLDVAYSTNNSIVSSLNGNISVIDSIRYYQVKSIADNINTYNRAHQKLWWAAVTPLSLKNYSDKKRILQLSDNESSEGIEYYNGGIFELGDISSNVNQQTSIPSLYIDNFDWRNRHGKNWMTSCKNQGNSGYCTAFATISSLEAMVNLYYNQLINMDLSEQEAACCSGFTSHPYDHVPIDAPLIYISCNGVCDEASYPFVDQDSLGCESENITPQENVKCNYYSVLDKSCEDSIKKSLIQKGPLVSSFRRGNRAHAVCLTGYGVLHAGDSIRYHINGWENGIFVVPEGDSRIGMTYWKFKNSYGLNLDREHEGYMYMMFSNLSDLTDLYSIDLPIVTTTYSNANIVCEDRDGDGYYNWGLGERPSNCPSSAQYLPDGDDTNPDCGPMDEYGYLEDLNASDENTIFINSSQSTTSSMQIYNNIVIQNNATWTVKDSLYMHHYSKIFIRNGSTLYVKNQAVIKDVGIVLDPGGNLIIDENGKIKLAYMHPFFAPLGSTVDIKYGSIE
jgi:C1A family cysteine protease